MPVIEGDWWPIAGDPDLGEYTRDAQQPVDFAIWQAADGTWQLWSCIRQTGCGGNTRLFHRWEGRSLTDRDWEPRGIAMEADPRFGETPGGLQAPHVILADGIYHMLYGDWESICLARSRDGKDFEREVAPGGVASRFSEGRGANTRDPMALRVGDLFHIYYTAFPGDRGAVYCRTSPDLRTYGESHVVAFGGLAGTSPYSAECPHVVYRPESDAYYLFRTQRYGEDAQTTVYCSPDPMDFGVEDDRYRLGTLPIAAPEIVVHEGEWYVAALSPDLKGIRMARLEWNRR